MKQSKLPNAAADVRGKASVNGGCSSKEAGYRSVVLPPVEADETVHCLQ